MKITHVIRAEEHLSNTPRQIFMLEGLGYPRPEYAHLPFVAEPGSKKKLSKREIPQYLKNPDFKKVYDHGIAVQAPIVGLEVATKIKAAISDWRQRSPKYTEATAKSMAKPLLEIVSRYSIGLTMEKGNEVEESLVRAFRR